MSSPSPNYYLENYASLIPALDLLVKLGYIYLRPSAALAARHGRKSRVVLETVLADQLRHINRITTHKGQTFAFSDSNIQKAVDAISPLQYDSLLTTSEAVYNLITLGKALEQTIEVDGAATTKSYQLRYIDWEHPDNNIFHVCDEFEVERRHSKQTRRPDVVLFVNGIPLVIIECKRPDRKDAIKEAISQHLRNQGADEVPELYVFGQLLLALAQNKALYATIDTRDKFWAFWKEEAAQQQTEALRQLFNTPLTVAQEQALFTERNPAQVAAMREIWAGGERQPSEQDRAVHSLLSPARLLELTYRYIVYDNKVKKVARYQQYFAVRATVARIKEARGDEVRKGGVIWHTTGSGKSLTMVMLAKAIALEPGIVNARIVLVTDRVDLDDQIYRTFFNCGKQVAQAQTGEQLIDLITQGKATIITAIINKFTKVGGKRGVRDLSPNIFVLVDESHRTNYGEMHAHMRNVFPNACYIGFTGTPLLKEEKETARKFGGFIHAYTMGQAIADKAVTPLLYEGRYAELRGEKAQLDKWFERVTQGLTLEQKADLKKKFRREEELAKSDERIKEIAYDIGQHFKSTLKGSGLKGQLAVSGKEMALRYKKYLDDFGEVSSEVIISAPDTREGHGTTDESDIPAVQKFWKDTIARFGNEETYLKKTLNAFIYSEQPEILIVVDKLLTGFDAPPNAVLYIDKSLNGHNILQAIARVNRLFDGKEHGLIIDYRGIFGAMRDAIDTYAELEEAGFDREDLDGTISDVSVEIAKLPERHTHVWDVFKRVANKSDIEAMQLHLEPLDIREHFYDALSSFARTLQLAVAHARWQEDTPETTKQRYRNDLKSFLHLRNAVKQRFGETIDYSSYEVQIRNLVNQYIGSDGITQIIKPVDIFASEGLDLELAHIEGDAAKADAIASRMKKTITERMEEDPVLYQRLSELIDQTIAEHRARRLADAEYLEKVQQQLLPQMTAQITGALPASLAGHADARAYFGVVQELLSYDAPGPDLCAGIALKAEQVVDDYKIRDWQNNQDVVNAMFQKIDDHFDELEKKQGYKVPFKTRDNLIEQLIRIAKKRDER